MLCVSCAIYAHAQQKTDAFFNYQYYDRAAVMPDVMFNQAVSINNMNMNVEAVPIGNGLYVVLLMTAFYFIMKRKEMVR